MQVVLRFFSHALPGSSGFAAMRRRVLTILVALVAGKVAAAADPARRFVYAEADGRLTYVAEARGDRVPDFSHAGYGGGAAVPDVRVAVVVPAERGDNGPRIQAAIDQVAQRKPDA